MLKNILINLIGVMYCYCAIFKIRYHNYVVTQRIKWVMAYKRYL